MIIAGEDLLEIKDEGGDPAFGGNIEDGYFRDYHGNLFELNIPDELIDKYIAERDAKYYLHVLPGLKGYLNVESYEDDPTTVYILDENDEPEPDTEDIVSKFTQSEIDKLCKIFPYIDFWAVAERVETE